MKNNNFKAFTLAELMITVVIIGILATMMLTNLMSVKPDENALLYKKAFYSMSEAISALTNDSTKFPEGVFDSKITTETGITDIEEYFCTEVANALNTLGVISCATERNGNTNIDPTDGNYDFKLSNGTLVAGLNHAFDDEDRKAITPDTLTICVDVNGAAGPNAGCAEADRGTVDKDQFRIRISRDGKVSTGSDDEGFTVENGILGGNALPTVR